MRGRGLKHAKGVFITNLNRANEMDNPAKIRPAPKMFFLHIKDLILQKLKRLRRLLEN